MEEKNEKFLPVGSVCLLKGGQRYIVVAGFLGISGEDPNTVYDYIGAPYPLGIISSDVSFMFNHDQIEKVVHLGFDDDEGKEFREKLKGVTKEGVLEKMKQNAQTTATKAETPVSEPTNSYTGATPIETLQPVSFDNIQ